MRNFIAVLRTVHVGSFAKKLSESSNISGVFTVTYTNHSYLVVITDMNFHLEHIKLN